MKEILTYSYHFVTHNLVMKLNHKLSDVIIKGLHESDVDNIYFLNLLHLHESLILEFGHYLMHNKYDKMHFYFEFFFNYM